MKATEKITVFAANGRGDAQNCQYPRRIEITDDASAMEAFSRDIVCAEYRNNYRNGENFLCANALPMDCDNDHSDDPGAWFTAEDIAEYFSDVPYVIHYSRHHLKQKESKSPRPRFHVVFLINPIANPAEYAALKQRLWKHFTFFDNKALDAARFLFGTENPEVAFHPGSITLNTFLEEYESEQAFAEMESATIPEGSRNNTMCSIGARIIKRYGDTTEAKELFFQEAEKCDPPLEDSELETIWKSNQKLFQKLVATPGYIPPEAYNSTGPLQWETPIPFDEFDLPTFPADALPPAVRDFVLAVAETTQTSVDMAAVASLGILAICSQGKFRIWGKPDWSEPLNLYCVVILPPGERKSAVISLMTEPVEDYEKEVNLELEAKILESQMKKTVLEKERKNLEDQVAKGKTDASALADKAKEIAAFREVQPLKLFVDDVTPEKLASILAENNGHAAIVSAEGGIFDIQGSHEVIIPMEQFDAVQAEIKRRSEKHSKPHRNKGKYPFSGLLICGECGKHYIRKTTATGAVWICPTYCNHGKTACPSKRIPEATLTVLAEEVAGDLAALPGRITAVRVEKSNTLVFCFADGNETVKRWQDRSRAESWTEEMRAAAAEKTRERKKKYA